MLAPGAFLSEFWQHDFAEVIEERSVAKKGRVVRGHRFGYGARERLAGVAQLPEQRLDIPKAEPARNRRKASLDQMRPVRRKREPRAAPKELREIFEVVRIHGWIKPTPSRQASRAWWCGRRASACSRWRPP